MKPRSQPKRLSLVTSTPATKTENWIVPLSWHRIVEFEPPIVGCVICNRNYSFEDLKAARK